jgi:signal transduction histidine kinase
MARRALSDRDPGNGVEVRALRAGITHRKQAEGAIRELDIIRYVASLAAAAAHEINNPLTVVVDMSSSWPTRWPRQSAAILTKC